MSEADGHKLGEDAIRGLTREGRITGGQVSAVHVLEDGALEVTLRLEPRVPARAVQALDTQAGLEPLREIPKRFQTKQARHLAHHRAEMIKRGVIKPDALATSVPDERPRSTHEGFLDGPEGGTFGPIGSYEPLSEVDETNGKQLRRLRMDLGLMIREAAAKLGLTVVELSECERGVRSFSFDEAKHLLSQG